MKKIKHVFGTIMLILLVVGTILVTLTIKKSKGCNQIVIDTFEVASGINIPKQTNAKCYFDSASQTRVGIYSAVENGQVMGLEEFSKVEGSPDEILWTTDMLLGNGADFPLSSEYLYKASGENRNNSWQCVVDIRTGMMWCEIKWI